MSGYETVTGISAFRGLSQAGDGYTQALAYAREMENVNVTGGAFSPMRAGRQLQQELESPIGTLACLHRRYNAPAGEESLLVAICDGSLYTKTMDGEDDWVLRYPLSGEGLTESDCDWVTYEVNPEGSDAPIDVLLFTNAVDGMYCLYGNDLHVEPVVTPARFGVLARFNERIWGAGIADAPDTLMYSAAYDPFDWDVNLEIPEDGAGEIQQPSWDGDSFVALRQLGSNLLAIKRNAIWRIYGTDPGTFVIQQQYGGGTIEENTVSVYGDYAYMLGWESIMRYDGNSVAPFNVDDLKLLMQEQVNWDVIGKAVGAMHGETYCLALPINGSSYCNAILEYNTRERTYALRTRISVDSFLQVNNRLFYTSGTSIGRVFELRDDMGDPLPCVWRSGWQDLGAKNVVKSDFHLYLVIEAPAPVPLYLGIRTEKRLKQKIVNLTPGKPKRVMLSNRGRYFKVEIQSYSAVPYHISGGLQLYVELDAD